tara:strand:- start:131 stop:1243 length:1113 start_codon:yes stop_codon:yes gene_type:complete
MRKSFVSLGFFALMALPVQAQDAVVPQLYLYDMTTQTVLESQEANAPMYPASMTKLMTLYLLFDRIKSGEISMESEFTVSPEAWRKGGSKMFVRVNTLVPVEALIQGIAVQSGNDACIVVAEALAGSEEAFAELMNKKAKELGLTESHFKNSTGWPDPEHVMSPHDLSVLAEALIRDFPEYYHYFAEREYTWSGITQPNRNPLLSGDMGVDGLKTGHTEDAGYGITLSAKQNDRRLIAVLNGMDSQKTRAQMGRVVLLKGFTQYKPTQLFAEKKDVAELPVWYGSEDAVSVGLVEPLNISLPVDSSRVSMRLEAKTPLQAPIEAGQEIGTLQILFDGKSVKQAPVTALQSVERAGFFKRLRLNLQSLSAS